MRTAVRSIRADDGSHFLCGGLANRFTKESPGSVLGRSFRSLRFFGVWAFLCFFVLFIGPALLWFVLVPKFSLRLAGGNRDRQRLILQCVVHTPFFARLKILARFLLAVNYQESKQYRAAEALFRAILRDGREGDNAWLRPDSRLRLADTIEALGRPEEAAAERKRAAASTGRSRETAGGLRAQAKLLEQAHHYDEAYGVYERALSLAPPKPKVVHLELMSHLTLTAYNAGRPADSLRWAAAPHRDRSQRRVQRSGAANGGGRLRAVGPARRCRAVYPGRSRHGC